MVWVSGLNGPTSEDYRLYNEAMRARLSPPPPPPPPPPPTPSRAVTESGNRANTALGTYRGKVRTHQDEWVRNHRNVFETQAAAQAAWEAAWERDGETARQELNPALNDYSAAVQLDLRRSAEGLQGPAAQKAIQDRTNVITGATTDGSANDVVLDGIVTDASTVIQAETPEVRAAAVVTSDRLGDLATARTNRDNVNRGMETEMPGQIHSVHNGALRQEIRDSWQGQLNAAETKVTEAETAAQLASENELSLRLAADVLGSAQHSVEVLEGLPSGQRNAEEPSVNGTLATAQSQYDDLVAGRPVLLQGYSDQQVANAYQGVLGAHPEINANDFLSSQLMLRTAGLAAQPDLTAELQALDPNDPSLPDWLKDLAEKDRVSAALVMALDVTAEPSNDAERALAEHDPVAFAFLKYAGGSLPDDVGAFGTQATSEEIAAGSREHVSAAIVQLQTTDPQRFAQLQILMEASGDVRADWVATELPRILDSELPGVGVERRMGDRDREDGLTAGERAVQFVTTNIGASFTPEQMMQVWDRSEAPLRSYIGEQAKYLQDTYAGDYLGDYATGVGAWLEGMSEYAAPPVAELLLNEVTTRFDPSLGTGNGSGVFLNGLQQTVDRAPHKADDIAIWGMREGSNGNMIPKTELVALGDDGNGIALAEAVIDRVEVEDGNNAQATELQSLLDYELEDVNEDLVEDRSGDAYNSFMADSKGTVQQMFNNLLPLESANFGSLFGQTHDFTGLTREERRELIGEALTAISGPNVTDEQIKQVDDWIEEAGGGDSQVTFIPTIYVSRKDGGVTPLPLIRVEDSANEDAEDYIIDTSVTSAAVRDRNVPWKYNNLGDYINDNQLDTDGKLYLTNSEDLLLGRKENGEANVNLEGIDAANTTGWERVRRVGDIALGIGGTIAGIALIVGTGGLAAPVVAGAALAWGVGRTIETAVETDQHGQDFNPIRPGSDGAWLGLIDPHAGSMWLGGIASATGLAALRPGTLLTSLRGLGSAARSADDLALIAHGATAGRPLSTGVLDDLFRSNGLQMAGYRNGLGSVHLGISVPAQISGAASDFTDAATIIQAIAAGEVDFTDWSLMSQTWDVLTIGAGTAGWGAGHAAQRSRTQNQLRDAALAQSERSPVFWVNRRADGTLDVRRATADGGFAPIGDGALDMNSLSELTILETSVDADGNIVGQNIHHMSRGTNGANAVTIDGNGQIWRGGDVGGRSFTVDSNGVIESPLGQVPVNRDGTHRVFVTDTNGVTEPILVRNTPGTNQNSPIPREDNSIDVGGQPNGGAPGIARPDLSAFPRPTDHDSDDPNSGGTRLPEPGTREWEIRLDAQDQKIREIDQALIERYGAYFGSDRMPAIDAVSVLPPQEFIDTYLERGGDEEDGHELLGFVDETSDRSRRTVWLVDDPRRPDDPGFDRLTGAHEILHRDSHPEVRRSFANLILPGDDNFYEGLINLLAFRAVAPRAYADLPDGFQRFAQRIFDETGEKIPYMDVTIGAERTVADIEPSLLHEGVFRGHPVALDTIFNAATRHGWIVDPGPQDYGFSRMPSGMPADPSGGIPAFERLLRNAWAGQSGALNSDHIRTLADGVWPQGTLADPTPEMIDQADRVLDYERLPPPAGGHTAASLRADAIYLADRDTMALTQGPEQFDVAGLFQSMLRDRLAQFGINPNRPGENLDHPDNNAVRASYGRPASIPPVQPVQAPPATPAQNVPPPQTQPATPITPVPLQPAPAPQTAPWHRDPSIADLVHVRPTDVEIGPWSQRFKGMLNRMVARAASKAPTVREIYDQVLADSTRYPNDPSPFAQQLVNNVQYLRTLFSVAHDAHAHPEGYDSRLGDMYVHLIRMAGRYAEVYACGIPQACGVGHYTDPNSPPPSYARSQELDQRHLGNHLEIRDRYRQWTESMQNIAQTDPGLAQSIDAAAFNGRRQDGRLIEVEDLVNRIPDDVLGTSPRLVAAARHDLIALAEQDPHLALNAHLSVAGFNPARSTSAEYLLLTYLDNYYEITGAGETTLLKENIWQQLRQRGEEFNFDDPDHIQAAAQWLAVQQAMGKMTLIHSDWATGPIAIDTDQRLEPRSDHGYDRFDALIDLIAPFAQSPDSSIILAHTGIGRYVKPDLTLKNVPGWLGRDAGYGNQIPHHILKMEEAVRRAPGVKFDISWNDVGIEFATRPDLRAGLINFIQRHPDAVLFGSDTVKPVNRSQYLQNLTTLTDFFVELGAVDANLPFRVLRANYETLADRSFEMTLDASGLNTIASDLEAAGQAFRNPAAASPMARLVDTMHPDGAEDVASEVDRLAGLVRAHAGDPNALLRLRKSQKLADQIHGGLDITGPDGAPIQIVRGRTEMRAEGAARLQTTRYDWIHNLTRAQYDRVVQRVLDPSEVQDLPLRRVLDGRPGEPDPTDMVQSGTAAGARWKDQRTPRLMMLSDGTVTLLGGAAGFIPGVGLAAGLLRVHLFARGVRANEFHRRAWEWVFEESRLAALGTVTQHVVRVGNEMGLPKERLGGFVDAMARMETDYNYIRDQTAGWPEEDRVLAAHAMMAVVGIGQSGGDSALGLQASSLSEFDPRLRAGRVQNLLISTSSAASTSGAGMITYSMIEGANLNPGQEIAAYGTGAAFFLAAAGTQGLMIWRNLWANRLARGNINPELDERYGRLQRRILGGLELMGGTGALNNGTLAVFSLANGSTGLQIVTQAGAFVLDLGLVYTARRARQIEASRQQLQGARDPETTANAMMKLLGALGLDTAASGTSIISPATREAWLNALEKMLDRLGF